MIFEVDFINMQFRRRIIFKVRARVKAFLSAKRHLAFLQNIYNVCFSSFYNLQILRLRKEIDELKEELSNFKRESHDTRQEASQYC